MWEIASEIQNSWKIAADDDKLHAWHSLHFIIHFMQHITSISLNGMTLHAYPTLCTYSSVSVTKIKEKTAGHNRWTCWNNTWLRNVLWSLFKHVILTPKMQSELVQGKWSSLTPVISITDLRRSTTPTQRWNQRHRPITCGTHSHDHF